MFLLDVSCFKLRSSVVYGFGNYSARTIFFILCVLYTVWGGFFPLLTLRLFGSRLVTDSFTLIAPLSPTSSFFVDLSHSVKIFVVKAT